MTSPIKSLIQTMRELREKEAWLIYSCADGTYDSHLVIGTQEDCKAALQKALWDGGDNEIPDHVTDTLKNFMDPENWGMDYGEWIEEGEQYYIGVKRVCNFTFPTNQERLEKALEIAVEALDLLLRTGTGGHNLCDSGDCHIARAHSKGSRMMFEIEATLRGEK